MTILAFLQRPSAVDYGERFARLRWTRAVAAREVISLTPAEPAQGRIHGEETWVFVTDGKAIPLGGPSREPPRGRVLASSCPAIESVHTLRELECAAAHAADAPRASGRAAFCFRPQDAPPEPGETVAAYLARACASDRLVEDPQFSAFVYEDSSERERPELVRRVPDSARRLLDVGCGAGGTAAALKKRLPWLEAIGIESDPSAAARARSRLDSVVEGDASKKLARLSEAGESFDVFLFADVLEHMVDPIAALALARRVARPEATLVASVPNVGHLALVRDLVIGRFDPTPAGLADAGHLRWFDRRFLAEVLEESGWRPRSIEGEAGPPVSAAGEFLSALASWPGLDRQSLRTYQWIAVAQASP